MEEVGRHISELLFEHDCVIVPALGGFLASNQASRVLLPNHTIFPPYRRIAFNVYLKQNDGLLANHIVESEDLSFSEATLLIESFTLGCFETLDNGKKVNIPDIGILFYDKEKNLQFEAFRNINHLKDSYGMEAVHFLPINRDDISEKKKLTVEKIIRPSLPSKNEKLAKFHWSTSKRVIGTAVIVAGLAWFSLNLYFIAPKQYESTSLNPFDSQKTEITKIDSIRNIPADNVTGLTKDKNDTIIVANTAAETLALNDDNRSIDTKVNIDKNILPNETKENNNINKESALLLKTESPIKSVVSSKHYLIAGVFKIKENAQTMLLHLRKLGFTNTRIIEANNCNYVSYEEFDNQDEALALAESLHSKNLESWIWKH